jgi:hypothetical protein
LKPWIWHKTRFCYPKHHLPHSSSFTDQHTQSSLFTLSSSFTQNKLLLIPITHQQIRRSLIISQIIPLLLKHSFSHLSLITSYRATQDKNERTWIHTSAMVKQGFGALNTKETNLKLAEHSVQQIELDEGKW